MAAPTAPGIPTVNPSTVKTIGRVSWTAATDPDGDPLTYVVDLSTDNGATWTNIGGTGVGVLLLDYNFAPHPDTAVARVRVAAFDGATLGPYAQSGTFTLQDNRPPSAPGTPAVTPNPINTTGSIDWPISTDPDGDAVSYSVELSLDNGATWAPLGGTLVGVSILPVDFTSTPHTTVAKVRVRGFDGAISGDWATSAAFTIHPAPNAPTLGYPSGGQTVDRASTQRLSWTHSGVNPQAKYDLRYRIGAGAWTTVTATTVNQFRDFPGGTFTADDFEWQVRTYDSYGTAGPWSASGFFTAGDVPAGPTFVDPINGQTLPAPTYEATFSYADLEAWQWRVLGDDAGTPDETDVVNAVAAGVTASRTFTMTGLPNGETVHPQVRVQVDGLWSDWVSVITPVSFTPPAAPEVTVLASDLDAAISVTATHPEPTGTEPVVVGIDVWRRETDAGGAGIRIAAGLATIGQLIDWTPASGVDYEYAVDALGANGATTLSPWTGGTSTPESVSGFSGFEEDDVPTDLPTNIDDTYPDGEDPSRKLHQQYHDELHAYTNEHDGDVDPHGDRAHAEGLVAAHEGEADPHPQYAAAAVTLDADGTLTVDGLTVELLTEAEGADAFEAKIDRTGAATGDVPTLQSDGTLDFATPAGAAARGARVHRSAGASDQSIPNATVTAILFDAENFDTHALHDNAVNNSRIVLNKVGRWLVTGLVSYRGHATGTRHARIHLNGGAHTRAQHPATVGENRVGVTDVVTATAITDYVELMALQDSGGSLGAQFGSPESYLAVVFLGV